MPNWRWLWHAEVERFPNAVMAHHHPQSVNLGDVNAEDFIERAERTGRPDVIVFGSPCQSFSIAGRRLGLDDARGNLAIVALGIIARLKPRWFVFENVPGLLSSAEGRDFGLFLRAVDELGYSGAWTMLDAQFFGLAQRRERLFFVGCLDDWRGPASVLFEPESLCGDNPPRRAPGQTITHELAPCLGESGRGFERAGDTRGQDAVIAWALQERDAKGPDSSTKDGHLVVAESGVRRLTPQEAERLQGFPDGYTAITYRGKPSADGPRYRALGNSMAVPVLRWILSRIETTESSCLSSK